MLCSRMVVFNPVVVPKEGRNDPPTSVRPAECWSGPWPHNLNCKLVVVMWTVCFRFPIPTWRTTLCLRIHTGVYQTFNFTYHHEDAPQMQNLFIVWKSFMNHSYDIVWQLDAWLKLARCKKIFLYIKFFFNVCELLLWKESRVADFFF